MTTSGAERLVRAVVGSGSGPVRLLPAVVTLVLLSLIAACATAPPPAVGPTFTVDFPSPLSGPGRPAIERADLRSVDRAWEQLKAGKLDAALQAARSAKAVPHRSLLELQAALLRAETGGVQDLDEVEVIDGLELLTSEHPSWAAAWLTLASAAIRADREELAFAAARRGADLWRRAPWADTPFELEKRWITDRVERARQLSAEGRAEEGLAELERALVHDPEAPGSAMLKARLLIDLGRTDEADLILAGVGSDPEALMLRGLMAETRGDWLAAMDLYGSLPFGYEGKDEALLRAQLQWRLTVLPAYVHEALASERVTRGQLAVIILALAPDVETMATAPAPVLSDVVGLPYQREILTAVRADVLGTDPVEPRFHPQRPASTAEVADAIEAVCHLLGFRPPVWCTAPSAAETTEQPRCRLLAEPITGRDVATTVLALMQESRE